MMETIQQKALRRFPLNDASGEYSEDNGRFRAIYTLGLKDSEKWTCLEDSTGKVFLPDKDSGPLLLMFDNDPQKVSSGYIDKNDGRPYTHWIGWGWKKITHYRLIYNK